VVVVPKKSLGQHWLTDKQVISSIVAEANLNTEDVVLEIGPGLGTMTRELLNNAHKVIAVEYDSELARKLPSQYPGKNLDVINQDILTYDLNQLPHGYKVVANIPYYITNKIIHFLLNSENKPSRIVLLIQKEVAERLVAGPGDMSILSISAQNYATISLGPVVERNLFTPAPKVDSQVVILDINKEPLIEKDKQKDFFRVVKAGFSSKRKKLRSSLSAGLHISKKDTEELLRQSSIDANLRAESLSIEDWKKILENLSNLQPKA